jgi:hypothetical protein
MSRKTIIVAGIVLAIAVALGGWFWYFNWSGVDRSWQEVLRIRSGKDIKIGVTGKESDTSQWQTYRNKRYGYELKYPDGWTIQEFDILNTEGRKPFHERYVVIYSVDKSFEIQVGIKNADEKDVMNRAWRTGVGAEELRYDESLLPVGDDLVQKIYLSYRDSHGDRLSKGKDGLRLGEIWFCEQTKKIPCDGFEIEKGKLAFVQVSMSASVSSEAIKGDAESRWGDIERLTDMVLASIRFDNAVQ